MSLSTVTDNKDELLQRHAKMKADWEAYLLDIRVWKLACSFSQRQPERRPYWMRFDDRRRGGHVPDDDTDGAHDNGVRALEET